MTPTSRTSSKPSRVPTSISPTSKAGFTLPSRTRAEKDRAKRILTALYERYPDAHCELDFTSPLELLVATILSAQATDVGVNKATPALFRAFPNAEAYAAATPEKIEPYIKSIGLFRNKAKSIHAAATTLVNEFKGQVPNTMDELLTLRGVARKTANVVLGNAFGINDGVVVDTHVGRFAQRYGLTTETEPTKIERDLMALFPRQEWCMLSHLIIWHCRKVCKSRAGTCSTDPLCQKYCANA